MEIPARWWEVARPPAPNPHAWRLDLLHCLALHGHQREQRLGGADGAHARRRRCGDRFTTADASSNILAVLASGMRIVICHRCNAHLDMHEVPSPSAAHGALLYGPQTFFNRRQKLFRLTPTCQR